MVGGRPGASGDDEISSPFRNDLPTVHPHVGLLTPALQHKREKRRSLSDFPFRCILLRKHLVRSTYLWNDESVPMRRRTGGRR
jgi:hypothetical protein